MAQNLWPKAAADVAIRRVPVADGVSSVSTSATGITVDSAAIEDGELVLTLSAGTAGTTGLIVATFTTDEGETLEQTYYIPIVATAATGMTVRDACYYALRKIYGKDETPDASAMSDAVERLSDMLRQWTATGADVGATFPLEESTVIYCPPQFQSAIKYNLMVQVAELYDLPITPAIAVNAVRGLQLIKTANLSDTREKVVYF